MVKFGRQCLFGGSLRAEVVVVKTFETASRQVCPRKLLSLCGTRTPLDVAGRGRPILLQQPEPHPEHNYHRGLHFRHPRSKTGGAHAKESKHNLFDK